jgi:asparagine synthase (glutamine-hydrolysing)
MSGIFGIYRIDGAPVSGATLEAMGQALEHRGPDAFFNWRKGQTGIGTCLLRTLPEPPFDNSQFVENDEIIMVAADVRLDNRDELISVLGSQTIHSDLDDRGLLRAAYRKWGEGCTEKLEGDFAFAIWDERKRQLFCARDRFGVKPFYYSFRHSRAFAFASEMKGLRVLPDFSDELDENCIAEYLAGIATENESTFYQEIRRLPPGHSVVVRQAGLTLRVYYTLELPEELFLKSDAEYSEAFRGCFITAVKNRLRSHGKVGSMLSGGLDSSSITCVARDLLRHANGANGYLKTFSGVFDEVRECDERDYIESVLDQGGTQGNFVRVDDTGPFAEFDEMLRHQDCAFFAPGLLLHWKVLKQVSMQGINVLLDGFDGDNTVSYGFELHNELARNGRWLALGVELFSHSRLHKTSFVGPMSSLLNHYGINPAISRSRVLNFFRRGVRRVTGSTVNRQSKSISPTGFATYFDNDFRRRTQIDDRVRDWRRTQPQAAKSQREAHLRALRRPAMVQALEVLDHTAAAFGVELRLPFWDRQLVEFCLSLPPQQKLHKGRDRVIFRRAMHDVVPEKIRWRVGKTDFTPSLFHGLLSFDQSRIAYSVRNPTESVMRYISPEKFKALFAELTAGDGLATGSELQQFWRGFALIRWFELTSRDQHALKEVATM